MGVSRWRVMLSATEHPFLVSVEQIIAPNQLAAEIRACNRLRARRLMSPERDAWDRWDLGVKNRRTRAWEHVATGDHRGATTTTRARSAQELTNGLP